MSEQAEDLYEEEDVADQVYNSIMGNFLYEVESQLPSNDEPVSDQP